MSDIDYKYDGNPVNSFYRKFTAGDIWCEVEHDGEGGLFFHSGNSISGQPTPESKPIYFSSEEQFMEFCIKLIGIDHSEFENYLLKYASMVERDALVT